MTFSCCNCGDDVNLNNLGKICSECGGFACNDDCIDEHECDPEGDM